MGITTKHNILIINKKLIFRFVDLSHFSSFIIFCFIVLIWNMGKEISRYFKKMRSKYWLQHLGNLFYYLQLLIHHLQVIRNEQPSRLNLIIETLLKIKTRTTFQIQMTSTHMYHNENIITVFRPYLQPLIWLYWMLHYIIHLLSYTQQYSGGNYPTGGVTQEDTYWGGLICIHPPNTGSLTRFGESRRSSEDRLWE